MSLEVTSRSLGSCIEVVIKGKPLTEQDFEPLHLEINQQIELGNSKVVLNLQDILLLNSLGIGALIKTFTKCRNNGGELVIVNISEKISQVLILSKLNTVLNIAPSLEEAINLLK